MTTETQKVLVELATYAIDIRDYTDENRETREVEHAAVDLARLAATGAGPTAFWTHPNGGSKFATDNEVRRANGQWLVVALEPTHNAAYRVKNRWNNDEFEAKTRIVHGRGDSVQVRLRYPH